MGARSKLQLLLIVPLLLCYFLILADAAAVDDHAIYFAKPFADAGGNATSPAPASTLNCGSQCARRCSLSGRPRLCQRACGSCCARCSCVPPGTAGNYDVCPCYASLTTRGNRRKCP